MQVLQGWIVLVLTHIKSPMKTGAMSSSSMWASPWRIDKRHGLVIKGHGFDYRWMLGAFGPIFILSFSHRFNNAIGVFRYLQSYHINHSVFQNRSLVTTEDPVLFIDKNIGQWVRSKPNFFPYRTTQPSILILTTVYNQSLNSLLLWIERKQVNSNIQVIGIY